jgi:hypothetical protein
MHSISLLFFFYKYAPTQSISFFNNFRTLEKYSNSSFQINNKEIIGVVV